MQEETAIHTLSTAEIVALQACQAELQLVEAKIQTIFREAGIPNGPVRIDWDTRIVYALSYSE